MPCDVCPIGPGCKGESHRRLCEIMPGDPVMTDHHRLKMGLPPLANSPVVRIDRSPRLVDRERLLVVSRYDEDVSWVNDLDIPTLVYNKGGSLRLADHVGVVHVPNRGREALAPLKFIVDHYHRLPEILCFVQGHTHVEDLPGRLKLAYTKPTPLTTRYKDDFPGDAVKALDVVEHHGGHEVRYGRASWHGNRSPGENRRWLKAVWDHWFDDPQPTDDSWLFGYCAEWAVPRASITSRPLEFWRHALGEVEAGGTDRTRWDSDPRSAWALELIWYYLFNSTYKTRWRPEGPVQAPGLLKMAANFTAAAVKQVAAGFPMVPDDERVRRRAICDACPHQVGGRCNHCGCGLNNVIIINKQAWGTSRCPINKW